MRSLSRHIALMAQTSCR